jgi:hypothetical protein
VQQHLHSNQNLLIFPSSKQKLAIELSTQRKSQERKTESKHPKFQLTSSFYCLQSLFWRKCSNPSTIQPKKEAQRNESFALCLSISLCHSLFHQIYLRMQKEQRVGETTAEHLKLLLLVTRSLPRRRARLLCHWEAVDIFCLMTVGKYENCKNRRESWWWK